MKETKLKDWRIIQIKENKEKPKYMSMKILYSTYEKSPILQQMLAKAVIEFSGLERKRDKEGYLHIYDIKPEEIRLILTSKKEYDLLIQAGVEFSQNIDDLFV